MRAKKVMKLGDFLKPTLNEQLRYGLDSIDVCHEWNDILGPALTQYTSDISFNNGELSVRVLSSALKNELFMQRTSIVKKLNDRMGKEIVMSINLK